ncbi:hypothetical protein [Pseudomonas xionganensis]|uniref:Uncharacterized protein n=1 Tax=Pseudomonas xionganensis TaxID=2654845 RepID=A0A6I4KPB0_9PSED|nr:hypothetical protein [Pseudomonas xionganensis]MVW74360.1 hypothetical protein [Pseudomonas xionganensis]
MSGHIGLREDARLGHLLARRITRLFVQARGDSGPVRAAPTRPLSWRLADLPGSGLARLLDESGPVPPKSVQ